jgi:hypothetical protein
MWSVEIFAKIYDLNDLKQCGGYMKSVFGV